jgi:hypothetical protein
MARPECLRLPQAHGLRLLQAVRPEVQQVLGLAQEVQRAETEHGTAPLVVLVVLVSGLALPGLNGSQLFHQRGSLISLSAPRPFYSSSLSVA